MSALDLIYPVTDSECDRCHMSAGFGGALYAVENDEPGDWAYCGRCARVIAERVYLGLAR